MDSHLREQAEDSCTQHFDTAARAQRRIGQKEQIGENSWMERSGTYKKILVRTAKIIIFLCLFIMINTVICHYLAPTAHKSNERWDYYFDKEDTDTLFIGTSVAEMIREFAIDEYTGRRSVNMGTPSQYFATTRDIIDTAARQRPIDTVVLMMGFDALERDEDLTASLSVEKAYYDNFPIADRIQGFVLCNLKYSLEKRNITTTDSVNRWMSWPVSCTVYFDQVRSNWDQKVYYNDFYRKPRADIAVTGRNRYDRAPIPPMRPLPKEMRRKIEDIDAIDVSEESVQILGQMEEYCNSNGITFAVMMAPHRSDYAGSFGEDYGKIDALVNEIAASRGCIYHNMNDNSAVMSLLTDDYFEDPEHVNNEGMNIASGVMSDIMNLLLGKR